MPNRPASCNGHFGRGWAGEIMPVRLSTTYYRDVQDVLVVTEGRRNLINLFSLNGDKELCLADSEDWRRERAQALGFHGVDHSSIVARPENKPAPDYVLPMAQPAPAAFTHPVHRGSRSEATSPRKAVHDEPVRLQHRLNEDAPIRGQKPSKIVNSSWPRQLVAIATFGALALGGGLGWILRGEQTLEKPKAPTASTKLDAPLRTTSPPARALELVPGATLQGDEPANREASEIAVPEPGASPMDRGTLPRAGLVFEKSIIAATPGAGRAGGGRWSHPARPLALPNYDFSPSFNCRRATATVNRMICRDRELAVLDRRMSAAYYSAAGSLDAAHSREIDAQQTRFLNLRGRCRSLACVTDVYRNRIAELSDRQLDER